MNVATYPIGLAILVSTLAGSALANHPYGPDSSGNIRFVSNTYFVPAPADSVPAAPTALTCEPVEAEADCCGSETSCAVCSEPSCCQSCNCGRRRCCGSGCGGLGCLCCCGELDDPWTLFGDLPCNLSIGGWVQGGYHNNATRLSLNYGDLFSFNDVPNQFNLHQAWVFAEKAPERDCRCWDWGFRFDFLYGTDAQKTQAFGQLAGWDTEWDNGVYGWALPQAYVELANSKWSLKIGHFFTLLGYEVVPAVGNFFYSHALTMFNSEPFTHTGALASYSLTDEVTIHGGWSLGWDTGFDQFRDGDCFLGGISLPLFEDLSFAYMLTAGDLGWKGDDGYSHSIVFDWSVTDRLNYVFQTDYLVGHNVPVIGRGIFAEPFVFDRAETIGINQYLFYEINDMIKLGGRMEWWKAAGVDFYELTGGVNIRPIANFVIRPEIRYDWSPAAQTALNGDYNETVFGIDGIFTF